MCSKECSQGRGCGAAWKGCKQPQQRIGREHFQVLGRELQQPQGRELREALGRGLEG